MAKGKKAFTLLELMAAVVIISILAAFSVASYHGYQDRTAMLRDETNQKVLAAAVKLYAYDNNALPGSLSQLRPGDLQRAYALITTGKCPYTFLAYLRERLGGEVAEAVTLPSRYYQNNPNIVRCPSDTNGGVSYQVNSLFANRPLSVLLEPANQGEVLIFESDAGGDAGADPAADIAFRHRGNTLAVATTVSGQRRSIERTGNAGGGPVSVTTAAVSKKHHPSGPGKDEGADDEDDGGAKDTK